MFRSRSNTLIEMEVSGVVIKLSPKFSYIEQIENVLRLGQLL